MTGKNMVSLIGRGLAGTALGLGVILLLFQISAYLTPEPAYHGVDFFVEPGRVSYEGVVISDTTGSLEEIIVHFTIDSASAVLPAYQDFFRQMSTQTKVYVACPEPEDYDYLIKALQTAGIKDLKRFEALIMDCPITSWARDRFLAKVPAKDGLRSVLVLPPRPETGCEARINDWFVPWKLSSVFPQDYQIEKTKLYFHGGDLINAGHLVWVDYNLAAKNVGTTVDSIEEFKACLENKFGKQVLLLGDEQHPMPQHHIEMYITPLDEQTVLVGDPNLALDLLDEKGTELLNRLDLSKEVMARFENVANQLEQQGFDVVKIPLLPFKASRVWASYNNIVMETRAGQRIVYLPQYDIPELDRYARAVWAEQGFEVKPIDVSRMYHLGGAIRCLVNVISRS